MGRNGLQVPLYDGDRRNWIYADILPSLEHSWRIDESLGVSVDYLATGREKKLNTELGGIRRLLEKANDGIEKMAG
jgi:hypothetical protein